MKRMFALATALSLCPLAINTFAAEALLPGQVDFGTFTPSGKGEFVEVNVPGALISLAAKFVEKEEPDVAKLLNGIKQVRVNVVGLSKANHDDLQKRADGVRKQLSGSGWERLVTAQKEGQDVGVYLKMDANSTVQGLTVVVMDGGKQAVFVNIVGDIKPEQLTMLGERLHLDPIKNLVPEKEQK
jgi:hypothetical protein